MSTPHEREGRTCIECGIELPPGVGTTVSTGGYLYMDFCKKHGTPYREMADEHDSLQKLPKEEK